MCHVEADGLTPCLQRNHNFYVSIRLPAACKRNGGRHAIRRCSGHDGHAVRRTLYTALGILACYAQCKLIGAFFHDEDVVIIEVVACVRTSDILAALAAALDLDARLVAHGRVAALAVKVLCFDLCHAVRCDDCLCFGLNIKVVEIPALMRHIKSDRL